MYLYTLFIFAENVSEFFTSILIIKIVQEHLDYLQSGLKKFFKLENYFDTKKECFLKKKTRKYVASPIIGNTYK